MLKRLCLILLLITMTSSLYAQGVFEPPLESGRAFALSTSNGLMLAERAVFPLPSGTVAVDWHPADARRYARAGNSGLLRFVDPGNDLFTEGVYTFPPFFDGYQATAPESNKLFVRDVQWSPDGEQLAFTIRNNAQPDLNQGVWFYQPLRELATDPSYQLLRPCPQYCSAAGLPDSYPGWEVLDFEWSPASDALLVTLNSFELGRRVLTIRAAQRIDPPPATVAPTFIEYSYGHYGNTGAVLVVSGRNPEGIIGFGTLSIPDFAGQFTAASDIGLAWVQDAVQRPDGNFLMLGNIIGPDAPLQLVDETGAVLTAPIGADQNFSPDRVLWSLDRSAVLLQSDAQTYVATIDGVIYDLTNLIDNSPLVDWISGSLPTEFTSIPLPVPESEIAVTATAALPPTATPNSNSRTMTLVPPVQVTAASPVFAVGTLLRLQTGNLAIFAEPIGDSDVVGNLNTGQELIVTGGPLASGDEVWYRVQTLTSTGWIRETGNLAPPQD